MLLKTWWEKLLFALSLLLLTGCANCLVLFYPDRTFLWFLPLLLAAGNLLPSFVGTPMPSRRLKALCHGVRCLTLFIISTLFAVFFFIGLLLCVRDWRLWLYSALLCYGVKLIIFWNGMLTVYFTSLQLGIKLRVIGLLCGMIPIANVVLLCIILHKTRLECVHEAQRYRLDLSRKEKRICGTRYPILLVHGVFFRDSRALNYWGRIPNALKKNGAEIYYGRHPSALSVADSGTFLADRIREIVEQTGCEKVNIIAHSKGGLDCRYALTLDGVAPLVASLTTVSSPHKGCRFADYLLNKAPDKTKERLAAAYNTAVIPLGEKNADFLSAVSDLTSARCRELFDGLEAPEGVYCRSFGSKLRGAAGGAFPLNFTYHLAKHFDGPGDGLVGVESFPFGENFRLLSPKGLRGISHADMVDLNRTDLPGFDVREFYVQLVAELKDRGL